MGNKDGMFRYADGKDKFLMMIGTLGSMGDGLQVPLMMFVLSNVINDYGNPNITVTMATVNKVLYNYFHPLMRYFIVKIESNDARTNLFNKVMFHKT